MNLPEDFREFIELLNAHNSTLRLWGKEIPEFLPERRDPSGMT
jgi:hypothetical protein